MMRRLLTLTLISMSVLACKPEPTDPQNPQNPGNPAVDSWLIPVNEIIDSGVGLDGIPSIDNPQFSSVTQMDGRLQEEELLVGVRIGEGWKLYPHRYLDYHELVNDQLDTAFYALNYCPLTGTALAWDRKIEGEVSSFGVSGLLFNSNLMPYDRGTLSEWSQMLMQAVHGPKKRDRAQLYLAVEMPWSTWKKAAPQAMVMDDRTGFDRPYEVKLYGTYDADDKLFFPVKVLDERLHIKERVYTIIIGDDARAYRLKDFAGGKLYQEAFRFQEMVIVGHESEGFIVSYGRKLPDGTRLTFTYLKDQLPLIMEDQEGNKWDLFGRAVSGPRTGTHLNTNRALMGYWFVFGAFYPGVEIFSP
ncbi:MAG: DUF3179 domain-containing protein [Bacteroidota bacterium]